MLVRRIGALAVVLGLLASAACSTSANKGAGVVCSSDDECATGGCLGLAVFRGDAGCAIAGKSCTKACVIDADCASLGANFKCFEGCSGDPSTCGAT